MPIVEEAQKMYKSLLYSLPAGHPVVVQMGILHWQHFVPLQRTLEVRLTWSNLRIWPAETL